MVNYCQLVSWVFEKNVIWCDNLLIKLFMKKITLLLSMLLATSLSFSQVIIGTGDDGSEFNSPPINAYYGWSYSQSIYLASEIGASGNITSIELGLNAGADFSSADEMVDVWIGHTSKSAFDTTTDWVDVSTLTQVLTSGTITIASDVLTITFNASFAYNGTDNLIIAIDANEAGFGSSSDFVLSTDGPSAGLSITHRSDGTNGDPTSPPTGTLRQNRGNITFNGITQACPTPTGLTVTPSSTTGADIVWVAGGSETNWTYEYGVDGFTQSSGTTDTAITESASLTGLTPGETYDIYLQANCGGDDSTWATYTWTQPLPPPSNDTPATAISLTVDEGLACGANAITGISNQSTTDSGVTAPSCGSYGTPTERGDLWYTVTAPSTGSITFNVANVTGLTSVAGAFYSGTIGSLVEESCTEFGSGWPWLVNGLTPGNTYYVRVWDYGNDETGTFDLCAYFTPPIVPNHITDFENYPDGWSEASGAYGSPTGSSSSFTSEDFGNDSGNSNGVGAIVNIYGTGTDEYLISPIFNLSGGTYYLNFDIALTEYDDTVSATLGADDYVALLVTEDGTSWTELVRWDSSSTINNTGQSVPETMLSGYGASVQFAFYAFSDTSNEDNDFFIDNFQITSSTLGVDDNTLEGFSLFPTIVKQNLNFTSLNEVEEISVFNLLGQQVFSSKLNVSNSSIDLSTLRGGIYIVKVKVGDKTGTYKIIKE